MIIKPKIGEVWWVDLSPVIGKELGGIRKCKILKTFECAPNLLYQIVPLYNYNNEPRWEHIRSVDIKRFREKIY